MNEIAPGSILQRMYFKKRIIHNKNKNFCEIGSGNGVLSNLLLQKGLAGIGFDLNQDACVNNEKLNKVHILEKKYQILNDNFITASITQRFDLIFSCMVIEHLDDGQVDEYFMKCKNVLTNNGVITVLVPSSMKYWGIEDEIAGHYKRYEFEDFYKIAIKHNLVINEITGLTYPISNWLFKISNKIISKSEGHKKLLSMEEQTIQSGNRGVKFKTIYPWYFKLILNEIVLFPFYILQRMFKNNSKSMVIYCELKLK